jgi:hypothetical protein
MLIVMVAIGATFAYRARPPRVLSVVPATGLYDNYRPIEATDIFHPDDTFFVSVQMDDFRRGMELAARWSYQGQVITETTLDPNRIAEGDGKGEGKDFVGFLLMNDNPPWPVGDYTVEIIDGVEVLGSAEFRVE